MSTHGEIRAWLVRRLAEQLGLSPDAIDVAEPFVAYGLGSTQVVALTGDLETFLERRVDPTVVFEHPTIEALARHLSGELPSATLPVEAASTTDPIAIIGIGCRFPGAAGPRAFFRLLEGGIDAVGAVPLDRFDADALYDPDPAAPGKSVSKWGGFLDRIDTFDASFFGIQSTEAISMDPQQRLLLEVSWEALEDACVVPEHLAGTTTGVFIGISGNEYGDRLEPEQIDARAGTGNALSIAASRISYVYDLRGPSLTVDTACSSSLVAVHQAVRSLRSGESTLAIAGGVNLILSPKPYIAFTKARILSPDGRCRTFDAKANGYVRGEGAGLVVLKPLSKAVADGHPIYAVIRGTALNQGGRGNGLMAPNPTAQEAVVSAAYRDAGVIPSTAQYVEAHGTGTYLGDPVEAKALGAALSMGRNAPCAVGSVKTNIGHLEAAAGVAGLIKTALCLRHQTLVPSLNFESPNPLIPFDELGLAVQLERQPWPEREGGRLAGVSSFGFGGSNAHVVLSEGPLSVAQADGPRPHVLVLTAKAEEALSSLAKAYAEELRTDADLASVARTAALHRARHRHRLAIVGRTKEEIAAELDAFVEGRASRWFAKKVSRKPPRIAFLFSDGGEWPGMGTALLEGEPEARRSIDRVEEVFRGLAGGSVIDALTDPDPNRLRQTEIRRPATLALQLGQVALWRSWGIVPDVVAGRGGGEIAARYVAGSLGLERALRLVMSEEPLELDLERSVPSLPPAIPTASESELSGMVEIVVELGGHPAYAGDLEVVPSMRRDDPMSPYASLARLVASGCRADLAPLYRDRGRALSELPTYPFQRSRFWLGP